MRRGPEALMVSRSRTGRRAARGLASGCAAVLLLLAATLAYVQWPVIDHAVIIGWLGALITVNLLRGPLIKSRDSYHGWVDLTPQNMQDWQQRIRAIRESAAADLDADTSSQRDRLLGPAREWNPDGDILNIGEIAAWILDHEEGGHRQKD